MDREAQARAEIGVTTISPLLARTMTAVFLLISVAVTAWHLASPREHAPWSRFDNTGTALAQATAGTSGAWDAGLAGNRILLDRIRGFEDAFDDGHPLTRASQAPIQDLLCHLGVGNEKAVLGRDGWLFYAPDLDYLTGPPFLDPQQLALRRRGARPVHPDPLPAILDFQAQLAARGIALVLLPVPVKPGVHPEKLSGDRSAELLQNPSWPDFLARLADAGVIVHDCAPQLAAHHAGGAFLATDTHWRPEAMQEVAGALARSLLQLLPADATRADSWRQMPQDISNLGDIAVMLRLPDGQRHYQPESVTIQHVQRGGKPWRPAPGAPVLLLGDSFTNIFSAQELHWGEGAGLAEQLAYHLCQEVDCIARNDDGAHATRLLLAQELAQGRDRLAGVRVVVWEFACRELAGGDWRPITLPAVAPPRAVATGTVEITGTVAAASEPPRTDSDYPDFVMTLHLTGIHGDSPGLPKDAVVRVLAMRQRQVLPIAAAGPGSSVRLRLRPWAEASADYGRLSGSALHDVELMLRPEQWFGESPTDVKAADPVPPMPLMTEAVPAPVQELPSAEMTAGIQAVLDACRADAERGVQVTGQDGWRFLGAELRQLGAGPFWGEAAQTASRATNAKWRDPLPVIVETRRQLAATGIELLVVPVPLRAVVYADRLPTPAAVAEDGLPPRIDLHMQRFYTLLQEQGVPVLDLVPDFRAARAADASRGPVCCRTDPHWSPRGAALAAERIAAEVQRRGWLPAGSAAYQIGGEGLEGMRAITGTLLAPGDPVEELPVQEIRDAARAIPAIDPAAPLLLLSDSHGLVFSSSKDFPDFGDGAGLREHLAARLGMAIDHLGAKGSAIDNARIELAGRFRKDLAYRAGKKVVVWCFAAREFTESNWRVLPLGPAP